MQTKGSMGRSRQTLSSQATARCSTSLLGFSNPPARFISDKKKCRFFKASSFWRWTSPGFRLTIRIVISSLAPGLIQAGRWRQSFQNFSDTFLVWWKSEKCISISFYIKNSYQLDLVLQSEEGGDLSGFMPNGKNFWCLLLFIVYLGVSFLITRPAQLAELPRSKFEPELFPHSVC